MNDKIYIIVHVAIGHGWKLLRAYNNKKWAYNCKKELENKNHEGLYFVEEVMFYDEEPK